MSYRITAFGDVPLPDSMTVDDLSTARAAGTIVDTLGGVFDAYGTRQRLPRRQELSVSGIYQGTLDYLVDHSGNQLVDDSSNDLIAGTATNSVRGQVEALRARVGWRDQLWRQRDDDAVLQWRYARLLAVQMRGDVGRWAADVAEVNALFETAQGAWRSTAAVTDSLTLTAALTGTQRVIVDGNVQVDDAIVTLTASATITSFRVTCAAIGVDWTWTGSLTAGQSLVVDCGALTVRKAGADAYSTFVLNSGHTAVGWLPLAVGANDLAMLASAAGTVSIAHYDQWL